MHKLGKVITFIFFFFTTIFCVELLADQKQSDNNQYEKKKGNYIKVGFIPIDWNSSNNITDYSNVLHHLLTNNNYKKNSFINHNISLALGYYHTSKFQNQLRGDLEVQLIRMMPEKQLPQDKEGNLPISRGREKIKGMLNLYYDLNHQFAKQLKTYFYFGGGIGVYRITDLKNNLSDNNQTTSLEQNISGQVMVGLNYSITNKIALNAEYRHIIDHSYNNVDKHTITTRKSTESNPIFIMQSNSIVIGLRYNL